MPYKDLKKQKESQRRYYEQNKDKYRESSKKARRTLREKVAELKKSPCVDCGGTFHPCAMQFDHIGTDKVANVGRMKCSNGIRTVLEEIAKCELVCANCHSVRSLKRSLGLEITDSLP